MRSAAKTDILDTVSRKLGPYVLLFGFYMISHGHMSPGGGFQGGVVLASGAILILLGCQSHRLEGLFSSEILSLVETAAYFLFIMVGIAGIIFAGYFLASPFKGSVPWMMYTLNMIIGIKVGAGVGLICLAILHRS